MQMEKDVLIWFNTFLLKRQWKALATTLGLNLHAVEVYSEIWALDLLAARYFRPSGSLPAVMLVNAAEAL